MVTDELIEDTLPGANLSNEEEKSEVILPFIKDAMDIIEKHWTYFVSQNINEKTFKEI